MKQIVLLSVYLITLILLSGCSRDHHNHPTLTTGQQLFNHHCAVCHGKDGTGRMVDATPANILTKKNRTDIARFIISGEGEEHERRMPIFKNMPYPEADRIAKHLLELKRIYNKTKIKEKKYRRLLIEP